MSPDGIEKLAKFGRADQIDEDGVERLDFNDMDTEMMFENKVKPGKA